MSTIPSEFNDHRASVLGYLTRQLGRQPIIAQRNDSEDRWSIGLAKFLHTLMTGLATQATIGLSEFDLRFANGKPFPGGIELLALTNTTTMHFEKALAALSFHAIKTGRVCAPGEVFRDVLSAAIPGVTVPHLFATDPFAWQDGPSAIESFEAGSRKVYWVMVVPISDGELALLRDGGEEALTDRLEEHRVDVADLWRSSVA